MQRGAAALGGEVAAERGAQRAVAGAVGREERRDAALAHLGGDAALRERAPEPAELARAARRSGRGADGAAVEVDHDGVGARARLAQQQVLHVEIGVPAAGVVEAAHGGAEGGRGAEHAAFVGRGGEERERVHGAFFVERAEREREERAAPQRQREHRLGHRRTQRAQPRGDVELARRAPPVEVALAEQRTEPARRGAAAAPPRAARRRAGRPAPWRRGPRRPRAPTPASARARRARAGRARAPARATRGTRRARRPAPSRAALRSGSPAIGPSCPPPERERDADACDVR